MWPDHLINVNDFLTTYPKDIACCLVGPITTKAPTLPRTRPTQCTQNVVVEGITKRIRIWSHRRFILRIAVKHSVRGRGRGKYEFTFRSKVIHRVYRNKISPPISYVCGACRLQKSDNAIVSRAIDYQGWDGNVGRAIRPVNRG